MSEPKTSINPFNKGMKGKAPHRVRTFTKKKLGFSRATFNNIAKSVGNKRFAQKSYAPAEKLIDDLLGAFTRELRSHVLLNGRQTIMVEDVDHICPKYFGTALDVTSRFKKRKRSDTSQNSSQSVDKKENSSKKRKHTGDTEETSEPLE